MCEAARLTAKGASLLLFPKQRIRRRLHRVARIRPSGRAGSGISGRKVIAEIRSLFFDHAVRLRFAALVVRRYIVKFAVLTHARVPAARLARIRS